MTYAAQSMKFDQKAYDANNLRALEWFRMIAKQFNVSLLDGYDDEGKTLRTEAFKAGDVFFHDRHRKRIFRSAELEIRNTWTSGHWTFGNTVHVLERKIGSPAAVYLQFSDDGKHVVIVRLEDQRREIYAVENRRGGDELMGDVNTYNAVFLELVNGVWRECETCASKWHEEEGSTTAQRSIKRMLGIKTKR